MPRDKSLLYSFRDSGSTGAAARSTHRLNAVSLYSSNPKPCSA
uniref:Uncharacterized protein n=1 Tax=Lotus japonicus TaxID=34305 RepID=I3SR12_LOTJA|nr:unknown [Lotus japonicus]